ncbi:MurR/RpiR family transcriptional regulator [Humibacter sp.]|uniref:MurR/RpiR family transcriptional regulator n=1 Tax=Humibacter sp. TaxID=1940291 RepID=UPI003F7F65F4
MTATPGVTSDQGAVPAAAGPGVGMRIQSRLPQMSQAMAKIASLLLESPDAPLRLSITELAESAGTSPATVTRFCRTIGFSGYVPLRVAVASDVGRERARETWSEDIGRAFGPDDSPTQVMSTLLTAHTRSLHETAELIDLARLQRIATRIAASHHVDLYGIGGSALMAQEMQSRLYRIGIDSHFWPEVHSGLTSAALQDEHSVAIGISNTGLTEETIQMLECAKSTGALTIAITNSPDSPLAQLAHEHIVTLAHEQFLQPDDLSAKHSQLFVLDLLYLLVAQRNFGRTTTTLAASALAVSPHRRSARGRRPRDLEKSGLPTSERREDSHEKEHA